MKPAGRPTKRLDAHHVPVHELAAPLALRRSLAPVFAVPATHAADADDGAPPSRARLVDIRSTRGRTSGVIVSNGWSLMVSAVILIYSFTVNVPIHIFPFFLMNWPVRIVAIV